MRSPSKLTERVSIGYPPKVASAIERAAERSVMTPSEYVRRSVIDRLKADGFDLAEAS